MLITKIKAFPSILKELNEIIKDKRKEELKGVELAALDLWTSKFLIAHTLVQIRLRRNLTCYLR